MLENVFDGSCNFILLQARKINEVIEYHLELDADLSKRNSVSLYSFDNPKSNIKKYIEISRLKSKEETKHTVDYNRNLENEKLYKSSNQIYCLLHL